MTTLRIIAARAHVSIDTVSRALNQKNLEKWPKTAARAERIRQLAAELGYLPNHAARSMRTQATRHIGIVMGGAEAFPYEFPVVAAIGARLQCKGYSLTVISAADVALDGGMTPLAFREQFLEGIFIMHVPPEVQAAAEAATPRRIYVDSNIRRPSDCVYRNERCAAGLAVRRVRALGYRRVLYAGVQPRAHAHVYAVERLRGVQDAAARCGLPCEAIEVGFGVAARIERTEAIIRALRPDTAVIATGHNLANFCAHASARVGLVPGRDYGLASLDEPPFDLPNWPWLSCVTFDRKAMGRQAAEMMLDMLRASGTSVPSVVVRNAWVAGETAVRVAPRAGASPSCCAGRSNPGRLHVPIRVGVETARRNTKAEGATR